MRPLKDLRKSKKNALIIIAHPDDETLFMGGTMAEFKRWRWTVLCVTDCDKRHNSRRRRELLAACRVYTRRKSRVKALMLGCVKKKGRFSGSEIREKIRYVIGEFGPFDIIFTHNKNGEYGHQTHKLIHALVGKMRLPAVYNFYPPPDKFFPKTAAAKCPEAVKLSPASLGVKRQALNVYLKGSQKTNLSKLKRLLAQALASKAEYFLVN